MPGRRVAPAQEFAGLSVELWEAAHNTSSEPLLASFRRLAREHPSVVTSWTLIDDSGNAVPDGSASLSSVPNVSEARSLGDGRVYLIHDHEGTFVVALLAAAYEGVVHLLSPLSSTDKRWIRFQRLVRRGAPRLSPVYLNESDFLALGDVLAEHGVIGASRLTARDLNDGSSYTRGWPNQRAGRGHRTEKHSLKREDSR